MVTSPKTTRGHGLLGWSGLVLLAATCAPAAAQTPRPDFNNDGYADLAIGCPGDNHRSISNSGKMIVMYGNVGSINNAHAAVYDQNSPHIAEHCEANDRMGSALAWGDFNGDGFDDIAVGVPGEGIGVANHAGAVHILYGPLNQGPTIQSQLWHQNRPGVIDEAETADQFGAALAGGDFNGDGFDDLAIGVPGESVDGVNGAGAINVLYGSANGLRGNGSQFFHQASPGFGGQVHAQDVFGFALVAGDFNGDGIADLAVGVPQADIQNWTDAGTLNVIYGSPAGLSGAGSQYWHQGLLGVGGLEIGDRFGSTLAVGDFNGDGIDDLAVAAPFETVGPTRRCGAVNVIFGSPAGLTAGGQFFTETQVLGSARIDEHFGDALAAGDLDGDGFDELVIGTPLRKVGIHFGAGTVAIINGSPAGLDVQTIRVWNEAGMPIHEEVTGGDLFGAALFVADVNGDGFDDLAVGVPGKIVGPLSADAGGAVIVALGTAQGIEPFTGIVWSQSSIGEVGDFGDKMGAALPK